MIRKILIWLFVLVVLTYLLGPQLAADIAVASLFLYVCYKLVGIVTVDRA